MDHDKFEQYLKERYEDQIRWYSNSSSKNKLRYNCFQWGVIILSASVPALIAYLPEKLQWVAITISVFLAIGTAALKTFKFQENWINYRTVAETLKKEKHYYDAGLDDYADTSDKEALFINRVESLTSQENTIWVTTHRQKEVESVPKYST